MTSIPPAPFAQPQGFAYPGQPPADPTNVMGRRVVAWLIDFFLFWIVFISLFFSLAVRDSAENGRFINECSDLQAVGLDTYCLDFNGDPVFLEDEGDASVMNLFALGYFVVIYVFLQGFAGASPGKFVMGLRVVNEQGKICGPLKSLGRSVLWIVDSIPVFIPGLVGFATGLTTPGHRRVGDMAASTYVIGAKHVGTPITVGGATGIPSYAPSGPQSAYGNAWAPNPNAPVSAPPTAWPPSPGTPEAPPFEPQAPVAPQAPPTQTPQPPPLPDQTSAAIEQPVSESSSGSKPQWDAARDTYIQWDEAASMWLEWNEATNQWVPITT